MPYDNIKMKTDGWSPDREFADWLHTSWGYPTNVDDFLAEFFWPNYENMSRDAIAREMQQAMTTNIGVIMPKSLKDALIQRGFLSND